MVLTVLMGATFAACDSDDDDFYFGKVINNSTRKKEVMVKVGEIWAPRNGGWWNFTAQKTFDHYVSYENNTWFNMRVLAR